MRPGTAAAQKDETRRLATALLQLDPTHEPACQQVMRACAGTGDIAGALAAYNRLRTVLEGDFDVEPGFLFDFAHSGLFDGLADVVSAAG